MKCVTVWVTEILQFLTNIISVETDNVKYKLNTSLVYSSGK